MPENFPAVLEHKEMMLPRGATAGGVLQTAFEAADPRIAELLAPAVLATLREWWPQVC